MSTPKADVLAAMYDAAHALFTRNHKYERNALLEAIDAATELIERDKVATQVFDCILRGVNDLSGPMGHRSEQFVAGWLESWAKSMQTVGFESSDPEATDIAQALARIGGTK